MDTIKIGSFLKTLRKEKNLSQEQLAERLGVAGRTVSRWETGRNMPDLSILIELAELYNVEISEILNGERNGNSMNQETKNLLKQAADYSQIEKEKAIKVSSGALLTTLITCAIVCVLQLLLYWDLGLILGELVIWGIGGITMLVSISHNGLWDMFTKSESKARDSFLVSIVCGFLFTAACCAILYRHSASPAQTVLFALLCFPVLTMLGYLATRILSAWSTKQKNNRP